MITYRVHEVHKNGLSIKIPVLHRVTYNGEFGEVYRWCSKNCKHSFYVGPAWQEPSVQFECDADAALFALRWS